MTNDLIFVPKIDGGRRRKERGCLFICVEDLFLLKKCGKDFVFGASLHCLNAFYEVCFHGELV